MAVSAAAFSPYSFARCLKAGDSSRFGIDLKTEKDAEIRKAIDCAREPDVALVAYSELKIGGKSCVFYADYAPTLVLRSLASNVRYRTRIKMPSRDGIVRGVIQTAEDATPMAIFRRDLESFYENIPLEPIKSLLLNSPTLSPKAVKVLESFLEVHCHGKARGLPRGLSLSAVLAELAMQDFDHAIRSNAKVHRYFRFSDDILIFSHDLGMDVDALLSNLLPCGLAINNKKKSQIILSGDEKERRSPPRGANPGSHSNRDRSDYRSFEYLGYDFHLSTKVDKKDCRPRSVSVCIADSKINKMKSRIVLSLKSFKKTGHTNLLVDRLRFLTSNYGVTRTGVNVRGPKKRVNSGIHFNYRLCRNGEDSSHVPQYEDSLKKLDGFIQSLLFSSRSEFSPLVAAKASGQQVSVLRSLSFLRGYQVPMMVRFRPQHIGLIKAAWTYVR